jgi:3D-(3,5/4)-trihydroxycyclohexane-1,2-dione acylhydrolase (decyclizing)
VVLGVGTRWSDFTTASRSLFGEDAPSSTSTWPRRRVQARRAAARRGRARRLEALDAALDISHETPAFHWDETVERATRWAPAAAAQSEVIGASTGSAARATSSSAPRAHAGDLHKLWRTRDPKGYHVEYGYSCMGYEIAGGLGVKLAAPDREVFVMVGDGSYLMMAQELVTACRRA